MNIEEIIDALKEHKFNTYELEFHVGKATAPVFKPEEFSFECQCRHRKLVTDQGILDQIINEIQSDLDRLQSEENKKHNIRKYGVFYFSLEKNMIRYAKLCQA